MAESIIYKTKEPVMATLVKANVVAEILGMSVNTVYSLRSRGVFPKSLLISRGNYKLDKLRTLINSGCIFDGKKEKCNTPVLQSSILPEYGLPTPTQEVSECE